MTLALVIPAGVVVGPVVVHDDTAYLRDIDTRRPEAVSNALGGWLEGISLTDEAHAYLDEEGKMKGLPANIPAMMLCNQTPYSPSRFGDTLVGTVIIFGNGMRGEEGDVPQSILDLAQQVGLRVVDERIEST